MRNKYWYGTVSVASHSLQIYNNRMVNIKSIIREANGVQHESRLVNIIEVDLGELSLAMTLCSKVFWRKPSLELYCGTDGTCVLLLTYKGLQKEVHYRIQTGLKVTKLLKRYSKLWFRISTRKEWGKTTDKRKLLSLGVYRVEDMKKEIYLYGTEAVRFNSSTNMITIHVKITPR